MDEDSVRSEVRKLWIEGPAGRLEAAIRVGCPARGAAVVAHPHPQHGGTLHNPVVFHADRELHRTGFTTLRFNFRGVGASDGAYDEGVGEVDDVAAAASWLRGLSIGLPLVLVGFSFGSVCSLRHAVGDDSIAAVVAIGLPVERYPIPEIEQLTRPLGVVQADDDEFGSLEAVRSAVGPESPDRTLRVIEGTSHLFPGRALEAGREVARAAESLISTLPG